MPTSTAAARCRAQVDRICATAPDDRTLRADLLAAVRGAVGFDAYAFLLTDPVTEVGASPLADVPGLPRLPALIRLKYLTTVNRWTGLDSGQAGLLRTATGGDPSRSLLWRELLVSYDIGDVASLVFRDQHGCWGFLDLWRSGAAAVFDADEARLLSSLCGPITAALRGTRAATFAQPPAATPRTEPVVLLLSADLAVLGQTPPAHDYLRTLLPVEHGVPPVPAGAYNVGAQLLAVEAGVDSHPARARVHFANGQWLTLRAARVTPASPDGQAPIAVSIEQASPAERLDLFARSLGLSARETELLGLLAAGTDTREAARRLIVSEHTVQDHLKSVFARAGVRSRRELLARALGS